MTGALDGIGVWSSELRYGDPAETSDAAAELEALGYTALWIPDVGGDLFGAMDRLLDATATVVVASGVLNVWAQEAASVVAWWERLADANRRRVMLGLGVSHAPIVGEQWGRPIDMMSSYLDELDAGGVPVDRRCLAALGPKMLALARDRTAGAHPYLVTPEHTARAREILGDALLAVEQGVVLERDRERARALARQTVDGYSALPNSGRSWKRLGFSDEDVEQRSDRLVDALIATGDVDEIYARVDAHRSAGADHVCIQVINEPGAPMDRAAWRALAPA
jgi:probable F420-dependent oxidoreductase